MTNPCPHKRWRVATPDPEHGGEYIPQTCRGCGLVTWVQADGGITPARIMTQSLAPQGREALTIQATRDGSMTVLDYPIPGEAA